MIQAMKRDEAADTGLNGDAEITDLYTGKKFNVRISVSKGYHHSDMQPKTRKDAEAMKSILNRWSWNQLGGKSAGVRPGVMRWARDGKQYATSGSFHLMPHDNPIYGKYAYDVGSDAAFRQGGQANYGHFCWHYIDSLALRVKGWSDWNQAMCDAAKEAAKLSGNAAVSVPSVDKTPATVIIYAEYIVDVTTTLNCRAGPGTSSGVIGSFRSGEAVVATMQCGDWAYVTGKDINGKIITGWSSMDYLGTTALAEPVTSASVVSKQEDVEKVILSFLLAKGLNMTAAAAVAGNIEAESGYIPNNLQNSYEKKIGYTDATYTTAVDEGTYSRDKFTKDQAGYGLCQWTFHTRKAGLYDYVMLRKASIADTLSQLLYMWQELQGYPSVMAALKNATSIRSASDAFMVTYLNPADQSESAKTKRAKYGQQFYDRHSGNVPEEQQSYTVKPGDTLSVIARDLNVTVDALMKINGITNPDKIFAGQVLKLP